MSKIRLGKAEKLLVIRWANGHCEYCFSPANISVSPFTVEHIVPVIAGGETILDNLAFACAGCNGYKYDKTKGIDLVTGKMAPLYHPRQHEFNS
jgi:5-methylcytosine-specific restriction endonuclease McrA